jgi:hypothetical protein
MKIQDAVTEYWALNYVSPTTHCTLCGNWGTIDTTGTRTPAGLLVGRKNFCICPNGQAMRKGSERYNAKK